MLAGSSFSLDKAARNLACGVHSFFIIYGQREKVDVRSRLLGGAGRYVYDGISVFNHYLAVCLFADLADFQLKESASHRRSEYSVIFKS